MGGPMGDEPPPHDEGGVVIDHEPGKNEKKAEPQKKKAKPSESVDYALLHKDIMRKIVASSGVNTINAIVETYSDDINSMQAEAPELFKEIQDGLAGKRAAFTKKQ